MAKVIVIGGHGKVARVASPLLVAAGHQVTSVIRAADQAEEVRAQGITPEVADVTELDLAGFVDLVTGHDAVVWSAGAGGGDPARTRAVDRDAAVVSVQAAIVAGVARYVMVSWSGSRLVHGIDESVSFHHYAQAKAIADAVVRDSDLDWTVLGPSGLTDDPATGRIGPAGVTGTVTRADVAAVIARCVDEPATIGRTIRFDNGDTPIDEFLGG